MTRPERLKRVERDNPALPISRQCGLLALPRPSVFHAHEGTVSQEDFSLMCTLDELHLRYPFMGSRRLKDEPKKLGIIVNRKRVQRPMRLKGLRALYPKQRTSMPHPAHRRFPYLFKHLTIDRPNRAWAADVTYIPTARGCLYLVAIIDGASRAVLSWRLSDSMEAEFCVEALNEAIARFGKPEIFNTDRSAQFTAESLSDGARTKPDPYQHGRQGEVARQPLHRAAI